MDHFNKAKGPDGKPIPIDRLEVNHLNNQMPASLNNKQYQQQQQNPRGSSKNTTAGQGNMIYQPQYQNSSRTD